MNTVQLIAQWQRCVCWLYLLLITLFILTACGGRSSGDEGTKPPEADAMVTQGADAAPVAAIQPTPQPDAAITPTLDIYETYGDQPLIARLEESLTAPGLSAEDRQLIEEGIAYQKQQAERRATAVADGATRLRAGDPGYVTPVSPTARPSPTPGIFAIRIHPPFFREYTLTTTWRHYEGEGSLLLIAGAPKDDPAQGVLLEWRISEPGRAPQSARYDTPTRSGSVRILAEQNGQLTLEAENGDLFVFDVDAREFVDDPPAPTPTVDPNATPTATATPAAAE